MIAYITRDSNNDRGTCHLWIGERPEWNDVDFYWAGGRNQSPATLDLKCVQGFNLREGGIREVQIIIKKGGEA